METLVTTLPFEIEQVKHQSPAQIAEAINNMVDEIEDTKDNMESILNQSKAKQFFNKAANIRELANNLVKQSNTISMFLNVVQALAGLGMANTVMITEVLEELDSQSCSRGNDQNEYMSMAKSFMKESMTAAINTNTKIKNNKDDISKLDTKTYNLESSLNTVESTVKTLTYNITSVKHQADNLSTKLEEINSKVKSNQKQIQDLERIKNSLQNNVSMLQSQINNISTQRQVITETNTPLFDYVTIKQFEATKKEIEFLKANNSNPASNSALKSLVIMLWIIVLAFILIVAINYYS